MQVIFKKVRRISCEACNFSEKFQKQLKSKIFKCSSIQVKQQRNTRVLATLSTKKIESVIITVDHIIIVHRGEK